MIEKSLREHRRVFLARERETILGLLARDRIWSALSRRSRADEPLLGWAAAAPLVPSHRAALESRLAELDRVLG